MAVRIGVGRVGAWMDGGVDHRIKVGCWLQRAVSHRLFRAKD
jgi:hypothetical protein